MQTFGERLYLNGLIKIAGLELKTLKRWNDEYPFSNEVNDGRFLAALLDVVFDRQTMSRSSLYGKPANNGGHIHDALNPAIMEFVKGTYLPFVSCECFVNVERFYFLIIYRCFQRTDRQHEQRPTAQKIQPLHQQKMH